jgi:hypothetical protein
MSRVDWARLLSEYRCLLLMLIVHEDRGKVQGSRESL